MRKKISAISIEKVPVVFDGKCLQNLAHMGRLQDTNLQEFAKGLHRGLRAYAQAARVPTGNDVHRQIKALEKAASCGKSEEVAGLLESLWPTTRDWIKERLSTPAWRKGGVAFPEPATLRDLTQQRKACELVRQLCTVGHEVREGRRRPSGKRSRKTVQPQIYGPRPSPQFARRDAELGLVLALQDAFLRATGREPPWTANHNRPGPFARMTNKVLQLAGAPVGGAVSLINELHRRRTVMRRRADKQRRRGMSLSTNNT